MSLTLGDIWLTFRADRSQVYSALRETERDTRSWKQRVAPNLNAPFNIDAQGVPRQLGFIRRLFENFNRTMIGGPLESLSAAVRTAFGLNVIGFIQQKMAQGMAMAKGAIIGVNAQLASTTQQFAILMKSTEKAEEHVASLFEIAKLTPFETAPLIQMSRMLQTFGGEALNTEENILLIGDAAAAVQAPVDDLGFWIGRLYGAVKAGQPFGEAAMRLQELAVLSGETRTKLENLQKAGASGPEVWKAFTDSLQEFEGAMIAQADTWSGLTSTLTDVIELNAAEMFEPLFQLAKTWLALMIRAIEHEKVLEALEKLKNALGVATEALSAGIEKIVPIIGLVWGILEPMVVQAAKWGMRFGEALASGVTMAADAIMASISFIGDIFTTWLKPSSPPKILPDLDKWGTDAANVWAAGWRNADLSFFQDISREIENVLATGVAGGILQESESIPMLQKMKGPLQDLITAMNDRSGGSQDVIAGALDQISQIAGPASQSVMDLVTAYVDYENASRETAEAQERLNFVTMEYDEILSPLYDQLDGVQNKMRDLRNAQRMESIQQKLSDPSIKGRERQMLLLEAQELALRRQINAQEDAKEVAQEAAQEEVEAAQQREAQAATELDAVKQRQAIHKEEIAMQERQTQILERMQQQQAAAAQQAKASADQQAGAQEKIQEAAEQTNEVMVKARERMEMLDNKFQGFIDRGVELRNTGKQITGFVATPFRIAQRAIESTSKTMKGIFGRDVDVVARTVQEFWETWQARGLGAALTMLGDVIDKIRPDLHEISDLARTWGTAFSESGKHLGMLGNNLRDIAMAGRDLGFGGVVAKLSGSLSEAGGNIGPLIMGALQDTGDLIWDNRELILAHIRRLAQNAVENFKTEFRGLVTIVGDVTDDLQQQAAPWVKLARFWADKVTDTLKEYMTPEVLHVVGLIGGALAGIASAPWIVALGASFQRFAAIIQATGLPRLLSSIGQAFQRVLIVLRGGLGGALDNIVRGFSRMSQVFRIGGLQLVLADLVFNFRRLVASFQAGTVLRSFSSGIGGIARALGGLLSPLNVVTMLITGFVGAWIEDFGGIRETTNKTLEPIIDLFEEFGGVVRDIFDNLLSGNLSGAWDALLSGFGGLKDEISASAQALQENLPKIFGTILQYLSREFTIVIGWVGKQIPPILDAVGKWAMAFISWVVPMIPPMLGHLWDFIASLLEAVGKAIPGIVEALAGWVTAFVDWFLEVWPGLYVQLLDLAGKIIGWIAEQIPGLLLQLGEWALAFVGWVAETTPKLLIALGEMFAALLSWIVDNREEIWDTLKTWITGFGEWIQNDAWPAIKDAFTTFFEEMWAYMVELWNNAFADGSIGQALLDGIKTGIVEGWNDFSNWFKTKMSDLMPDMPEWMGGGGQNQADQPEPAPPGRALGGRVLRDLAYTIGERGREIFIPKQDGQVLPNPIVRDLEQAERAQRPVPRTVADQIRAALPGGRSQAGPIDILRGLPAPTGRTARPGGSSGGFDPGQAITRLADQAAPQIQTGVGDTAGGSTGLGNLARRVGNAIGVGGPQIGSMPISLSMDIRQMGSSKQDTDRVLRDMSDQLVDQVRKKIVPEIYSELVDTIETVIQTEK